MAALALVLLPTLLAVASWRWGADSRTLPPGGDLPRGDAPLHVRPPAPPERRP